MNNDFGWAAGIGVGFFVLMLAIYLGVLALCLWIGYLIMRTAVKNGILLADAERASRGYGGPGGYGASAPGVPPQGYRPPPVPPTQS
ncbi:hypothetical protein ACQ143_09130 [Microbacterium sp. MC2]